MIRKIKWNDHAILGNLELDFTKPDGSVYNTIVLAGENGTGKTTILETLSTFLNLGSIEPFEYISYMADGVPYTITPNPDDFPEFGFHSRRNEVDGTTQVIRSNRNNPKLIESDLADLRHYGFSYSKARYLQNKTGNYTVKKCDDYIAAQTAFYNPALHAKASSFTDQRGQTRNYQTLSTYIRNLIDHPDPNRNYTQEELKCSTELLIELCR